MDVNKTKEIKLQRKHRPLTTSRKMVPELKISRIWLSEHGFQVGGKVEITVAEKQLIIKAL